MRKIVKAGLLAFLLILVALVAACSADNPNEDAWYQYGPLYTWNGTDYQLVNTSLYGGSAGNVSAMNVIADNAIVRGDGGARGLQGSLASINDFGTISAPAVNAGNIDSAGKVEADRLIGGIEGYSIDVVQSSDLNIALNDTLDITFLFVPDVIVLHYTGRVEHDTTLDAGHTTGHSVVTITGVDAMTVNNNYTALVNNSGAFGSHIGQNDAVNAVVVYGGNDGVDDAYFYGVGSWTTATKTLRLTFSTVANTNPATNFIEILAIAYR